ncbi:MAG TPA: cytochrome c3 family protein [Terriglobales bacterium]|nr:cytochrome c3 family protein [Terriglobales bacterium]
MQQLSSVPLRLICAGALLASISLPGQAPKPLHNDSARSGYVGNDACARCHAAIFESYAGSSMAHASGPAADQFRPADFVHAKSGVHYRIYGEGGHAWLSFERPGDPLVHGRRELLYYIGSGRRGLTYLFEVDGFLFESPVNWYGDQRVWDMAPAYQTATRIPMNLPAYSSCLHCHVSGMQPPVKGTENRYASPVLTQAGVACERCHGPGTAHLQGGPIVNPAKLPAARRDEVCMQCHLEGKVAIERTGHHLYEYRPGDNLSDYVRYFVLEGSSDSHLGAVSQFEAFAQSICKKKSADAMSCTSCHDPHSEPTPATRVSYYRSRCLACHGAAFGERHHPNKADCTACHMPATQSTDVAHTEVTDHRIPRRPLVTQQWLADATESKPRLVPFPSSAGADLRDRALAWQTLADRGMSSACSEAEHLLHQAVAQFPDDPALLAALAYVEQRGGERDGARELYQRALTYEPASLDAADNLGVLEAQTGHLAHAVSLWQGVFEHAPYRSSVGMSLAYAFCASGQYEQARSYTLRVLEFDPDWEAAKTFLKHLDRTPPTCGP